MGLPAVQLDGEPESVGLDLTGLLDFTPEHTLFIDFETYYDADYTLRKMSTEAYIRDPRFECIGVGVDDGDECVWMEEWEFRAWAKTVDWSKVALGAHHMHFDGLIASHHYGIIPGFYFDTMSIGRALHGVGNISLEKLMPKYDVGYKGHEVETAKGKHRRDFTTEQYAAYGEYCRNDTLGCKNIFNAMMDEGYPENELWVIDQTIRQFTDPQFVLDEPLLQRYLVDERKRKKELLERLTDGDTKKLRSVLMSNDKFAKLLSQLGEEPPRKISPTTGKETWAFAKSDPGMQAMLEHEEETIRWLAEARIATKSTTNETRTERFLNLGRGGRKMPVYIKYAGAHTFRDSGADGTNWQNLERVHKKKAERGAIRKAVMAPEDEEVVVADSGQIEARMTAWLADHAILLDAFRMNDEKTRVWLASGKTIGSEGDIYGDFGTSVFQRPINKDDTPIERQISKNMVLGLGFGMGWFKFACELLKGMLGSDPVQFTQKDADQFGVDVEEFAIDPAQLPEDPELTSRLQKYQAQNWRRVEGMIARIDFQARLIHCAVAKYFVDLYRETNEPITELWKMMSAAIEAMEEGDEAFFGPVSEKFPYGCLKTIRHGIVLPNGMTLRYPGLERRALVDDDGEEYGRVHFSYLGDHKQRRRLYGGMLTENIVQALARIVVFDQALYIKGKHGYRTATRTHDELVYVVPKYEAPRVLHVARETMKIPPPWALGLPLSVTASHSRRYGEAK